MTGFEIARVVLGSLPLIIVALEHYAEGVRDANISHIMINAIPALNHKERAKVRGSIRKFSCLFRS
jgi:hypothetical protein